MKLKLSSASTLYKSQTIKEGTPLKQRGTTPEYSSSAKPRTVAILNKPIPPKQTHSEIDSTNDITIADEQGMNQPRVNPINSRTIISGKTQYQTKYALSEKKSVVSRNAQPLL